MTTEKVRLTRDLMTATVARRLQPGWLVNLGVGMPTGVPAYVMPERDITFSSENGVIGYGELIGGGEEDPDVVNAGVEYVALRPGAAVVHHADSFAIIRRGLNQVSVLGAYEVACDGTFANWRVSTDPFDNLGGIGGAMDLAARAQQIWVVMEHTQRDGTPRLLEKCRLPITGGNRLTLVVTDVAVVAVKDGRFILEEHAPGWTVEEIRAMTGAPLDVSPDLCEIQFPR
jgi:3-oxoacid CoA-transferase B subunit